MTRPGAAHGGPERFVDAIRRNSDRLTALADDLLTLSSLESGTFDHEQSTSTCVQVVRRWPRPSSRPSRLGSWRCTSRSPRNR